MFISKKEVERLRLLEEEYLDFRSKLNDHLFSCIVETFLVNDEFAKGKRFAMNGILCLTL